MCFFLLLCVGILIAKISGQSCQVQENTDLLGSDIIGVNGTLDQCCNLCSCTAGCIAWSWSSGSNSWNNICWLKNSTTGTQYSSGVNFGTNEFSCQVYNNTDLSGGDIANVSGTMDQCCDYCVSTPGCVSWSWSAGNNSWNNICWLKNSTAGVQYSSGVSFGIVTDLCNGVSPDKSILPPSYAITDTYGNIWTLNNGYVYVNTVVDANSYNAVNLYWVEGNIYQENTSGQFYKWIGTDITQSPSPQIWVQCFDPTVYSPSQDGTTVNSTSSSYIVDKSCNIWTLNGSRIYSQNVAGESTERATNVDLILWYGGLIYYRNHSTEQFYVFQPLDGPSLACSDPRVPVSFNSGSFYGINGHWNLNETNANIISTLQNLGVTNYRIDVYWGDEFVGAVASAAQALQSAGIKVLVMIGFNLDDPATYPAEMYANETRAYSVTYSLAAQIAQNLSAYGVDTYEAGNELTRDPRLFSNSSFYGSTPSAFNNTAWPIFRGVVRGMIDGVRSVQPNARIGVNFCVGDVAASDMLWEGTQPDGSTGYTQVRWNLTTWHNYSPSGSLLSMGIDGQPLPIYDSNMTPQYVYGYNLPIYAMSRYGVPFWITEWNAGSDFDETSRSSYVQQQLANFYGAKQTAAIETAMYYELMAVCDSYGNCTDTEYSLANTDLSPIQPVYNTFQNFVQQNPDN